jgi:hypothetical protein
MRLPTILARRIDYFVAPAAFAAAPPARPSSAAAWFFARALPKSSAVDFS